MDNNEIRALVLSLGDGIKKIFFYENGTIIVNLSNQKLSINNHIYEFGDIVDCSITNSEEEDPYSSLLSAYEAVTTKTTTKTNTGSIIGRSIVGGAIGGTTGALIGGLTATKKTVTSPKHKPHYITNCSLNITINNILCPTETIELGSDRHTSSEIISLFKIILAHNENKGDYTQQSNSELKKEVQKYLKNLYKKARAAKSKIKYGEDDFLDWDESISATRNLYNQIFVNDLDSPEAIFYYFFFDGVDGDKYEDKYNYLYNEYINHISIYLKSIEASNNADLIKSKLNELLIDTQILARKLSEGYVNEDKLSYQLLLQVGNLIQKIFGDTYAKEFSNYWIKGISFHHEGFFGKEDFTEYIHKIQKYVSDYEEPIDNNERSSSKSGCMVVLTAIVFIFISASFLF